MQVFFSGEAQLALEAQLSDNGATHHPRNSHEGECQPAPWRIQAPVRLAWCFCRVCANLTRLCGPQGYGTVVFSHFARAFSQFDPDLIVSVHPLLQHVPVRTRTQAAVVCPDPPLASLSPGHCCLVITYQTHQTHRTFHHLMANLPAFQRCTAPQRTPHLLSPDAPPRPPRSCACLPGGRPRRARSSPRLRLW